ncbi:formyltetrahydrofolate deformylase [Variovorax sp. PCZ-1]|uniref:formyltetrahydrofolate deformylase n=1 Tax=Variovorax sp. PCZ-1 TaxID=2835533 RepID=UPI001BCBD241|nr:formyltetrahydrofolate deformylase [Variovorax sp. PCZ-1]MBS7807901.1 formyltetrahydrofolate deformylase [Variovorax sp. PCZ-1]
MHDLTTAHRYAITLEAASARGQVAAITALLEQHGAYIEELSVFDDELSQRFYLRCVFRVETQAGTGFDLAALRDQYAAWLQSQQDAKGRVASLSEPARVLIMVSKADHCLQEILAQWRRDELPMKIVAIASNHKDLEPLAQAHGIPFHHLPITPETKPEQEAKLLQLLEQYQAQWVVLARYMQVLSPAMCERLKGSAINIHHSFLPGFKGARPYEQAHARGVKMIGATAHFVTIDLDEGPIIEQEVQRVDHSAKPQQLQSIGRHLESLVLSRALSYVLEHRVFLNGQRVVVLR